MLLTNLEPAVNTDHLFYWTVDWPWGWVLVVVEERTPINPYQFVTHKKLPHRQIRRA